MAKLLEVWCRIRDAAWACSLVFAGVLHELISWLYCSLCIAKEWCLSSALLYELLYRRVEPQKTLGEWYSCHLSDKNYRNPSAKAPVIHPGDEAPFLVWGGEGSERRRGT